MSFRLESGEPVEDGLKRMVQEEIEKAVAEIDDDSLPCDEAVHWAFQSSNAPEFHEWRKAVRYHRYQLQVLRNLWRPVLRPWRREVVALSEVLGNDHDLAVLRTTLTDHPALRGRLETGELLSLIDQRSEEFRAQARPLGDRIYAEKPWQLGRRFCKY